MLIRKFSREDLESEPHAVRFKDVYPWDAIDDTPFGASLAIVEPGGRTMLHSHNPAETFFICRGAGTMRIDDVTSAVGPGDVVYLPPGSVHDLANDSATDELVFVSVFWRAEAKRVDTTPRLIIPSPPTSNGPLHLGHLAGPYVIADVMRRYYRSRGAPATLLCVTDEHQSYVVDRAVVEGTDTASTAARYSARTVATFRALDAAPDACVFPSADPPYRAAVSERFAQLQREGKLEAVTGETLYCEGCKLDLYDGYVWGRCPHCDAESFGFSCDACCRPNGSVDLRDPVCDRCNVPAARRTTTRLVFSIAPYAGELADYHRRMDLSPKLRRLSAELLALDHRVAASQPGSWGIPAGLDGQIISPWFEIALASSHLRERFAPGAEIIHFFGYDNAYLYLIHDPAVSLACDRAAPLPAMLGANEFLLLDNAKMSTSRQRALDADELLAKVPADLLRLYLVKVRPEDARMNANLQTANMFLNMVIHLWTAWLRRLGGDLATETGSRAPAAANPSLAPWPPKQSQFYEQLRDLSRRARHGYDELAMKEVSLAIHELVERAAGFGTAQRQLAGIATLATERATALALELAAVRLFAQIVAPVMPSFAVTLWRGIGEPGPIEWRDEVELVTPGTMITSELAVGLPASVQLA